MTTTRPWIATCVATTLAIIARACVLLAFSEFIFFNEGPVLHFLEASGIAGKSLHIGELIVFYCLPGALLLALEPMMTNWPRTILAGAFVGWSIEAAIVPVAYENVPFSLFWTSVSWHALIDVGIGWLVLRRLLSAGRPTSVIWASIALGALTALWSTWIWADLGLGLWQFSEVMALVVALLMAGYFIAGLGHAQVYLGKTGFRIAVGVNLAFWALWAVMFLPLSLALLALAAFTAFCLYDARPVAPPKPDTPPNTLALLSLLVAIPAGGVMFWAIEWTGLSAAIGELVVLFVAFGGVLVYVAAVFSALRNRASR